MNKICGVCLYHSQTKWAWKSTSCLCFLICECHALVGDCEEQIKTIHVQTMPDRE